jgi:dephospho-CoA kinase
VDAEPSDRFARLHAAAEQVRKARAAAPLLLVIDDLQRADAESIALLDLLARSIEDWPAIGPVDVSAALRRLGEGLAMPRVDGGPGSKVFEAPGPYPSRSDSTPRGAFGTPARHAQDCPSPRLRTVSPVTRVVGLTGGVGTGKSTVARMLAELGAVVIDADAIVHELQAPGAPMLDEIAEAFGSGVIRPDGSLDRDAVGARVFRDPEARARLNAIVHPKVGAEMARRLDAARRAGRPLVVLDIPLLFEVRRAGRAESERAAGGFAAVILVYCPHELQIRRQMDRDGCTRQEAERRVQAQLPIEEKRALADHVIDNSGTREETARQVRAIYAELAAGGGGA